MVESQIANLTPDPFFGHNLCFKCPNGSCKPILDIYVLRAFQLYKDLFKPLSFDPWNCPLKIQESTRTPSPKMEVVLGVWGFIPSHFPTLPGTCGVTPRLLLDPQPCKPFCLGREPKARIATFMLVIPQLVIFMLVIIMLVGPSLKKSNKLEICYLPMR